MSATLDKAYLEYSQITKARTQKEIQALSIFKLLLSSLEIPTNNHLSENVTSQVNRFIEEFDK